ncbi:helix-turn-helix transcriptional regulator [Alkalicoccus daliensis]|uniref:Predicted DNA-binding transcriptional regulator YafY, contains an HTH and WYL domains n=1 Tax=Alkalicoccus daliensis TaxID=745820 RepID=A0A1H0F6Y5_9BACI|nr:YafY family protein [Alkalicoccus daliensis]SDN90351.1 Predicted DNA-binding transcriptional regulator YafY, contains an HTH and WYL domains [Alkalicoccus daliensis]
MKKIERLISIVMILLQKEVVSASAFSRMFHVTKRTIQRDMETLSYANVPIYAKYGAAGGYALMEEYKFDKRLLNHKDIENIIIALGGFEQLIADYEIQETIQKIKGMTIADISPRLNLTFYDWIGRSQINEDILFINQAIENHWLLKFEYVDQQGNYTYREAEPYQLHFSEMHWYFWGYSLERSDYRTFKLTRMLNLQKNGYFLPRQKTEIKIKPYTTPDNLVSVKLLMDIAVRDQFIERYGKNKITQVTEKSYQTEIDLPENQFAYQFLAGFGSKVKILKPKSYIEKYVDFLDGVRELYS